MHAVSDRARRTRTLGERAAEGRCESLAVPDETVSILNGLSGGILRLRTMLRRYRDEGT
jgi:hypothetical protein